MDAFDWGFAVVWVAVGLFFARAGWVSLKRLRGAPPFPHREEMLWGASWWPPITFLAVLGPLCVSLLMGAAGGHRLPVITMVSVGAWGLLTRAFWWQYEGMNAGRRAVLGLQPDGTIDWQEYVARVERERKAWGVRYALPVLAIGLIGWGVWNLLAGTGA